MSSLLLAIALLAAQPESLPTLLARANALAARRDFVDAERVAAEAVRRFPGSRDAGLLHANLLLWEGRYASAKREFAALLAKNERDANARLGLAQAEYWSGDYRGALRDFRILHRPEAREIEAASRPGWAVGAGALRDDQPYHANSANVSAYVFSDPLTKWGIDAETIRGTPRANTIRLWSAAALPPLSINAALAETWGKAMPMLQLSTKTLSIKAERIPLLRSAPGVAKHPTADEITVMWRPNENAQIEAQHQNYFDHNHGNAADAWALVPIGNVKLGGSLAWRDTAESRFVGGVFDPYYTPKNLREARVIVSAKRDGFALHVDAGAGRETSVGSYHPWRVNASYSFRNFTITAERSATAFYTSNEIRAGLVGRF